MKLIKELGMIYPNINSKQKKRYALYECPHCGKHIRVEKRKVENNGQKSCSKCRGENMKTHGMRNTKIYNVWDGMLQRCNNKNSSSYIYYGGKGVSVCNEWSTFEGFWDWAKNGYKEGLTIDRINSNGNYEPNNCRWVTMSVQSRNTTRKQSNNKTGYRGVSIHRNKFSCQIKVNYKKVHIGVFDNAKEAAKAYDKYVIEHGLEHTLNFDY
jgi:hypothetical protein